MSPSAETLEGRTLRELLGAGPFARKKALGLAMQVAQALQAAHEKGVVHGDLRPEAIVVSGDRAKILDLGAAPSTRGSSPEQIRGEPASARSDLFAFGCVLYEMLRGRRPFAGDTDEAFRASVMKDAPFSLEPDAPPLLASLVSKCLQKQPADRFQSAKEISAQIAQCLAADALPMGAPGAYARLNALADVLGRPVGPETARMALRDLTPTQQPRMKTADLPPVPRRRPMGLLLAVAAAGLMAVALTVLYWLGHRPGPTH